MVKRFIVKILGLLMRAKGYSSSFGVRLIRDVLNDLFENKENSLKEKFWAYKRGFLSPKIKEYGLTEENYKLYISDFEYYKLYPINNQFRTWIDDKVTTRYILNPFDEYLPNYYCHIQRRVIIPLLDGQSIKNKKDIITLLKREGALALKPVSGSLGDGFYKLSFINDDYFVNSKIVDEKNLIDFLTKLDEYIVTEYIYAHSEIRKISDFGLNTLRLMVINENQKQPLIANAFMRFGTKKTGPVDNAAAGGVFTIVDIESGEYSSPKRVEGFTLINCPTHPDTDKKIAGILPHWELIKDKVVEISKYLSEITYMGFDVAITDNGFKIIEINSHQVVRRYQCFYPLLVDNKASQFFNKLLSEK